MTEPRTWADLGDWDKARLRWLLETERHPEHPRPDQITPPGEWRIWLILGGRGSGKTRTGAEDVSDHLRRNPGHRIAGVFETFADGRDVAVEGESGLLRCIPPTCIADWNRSLGELVCVNGARFDIYSADKPDQLRGPQHHRAWVDEPAKFRYLQPTWDNLMFGLRLGDAPQCVVTGTPKPIPLLRDLAARETTILSRWSTYANAHNLAPTFIIELQSRYEGTRLGRQEIHAELLDDYEGALWTRQAIIDARRLPTDVPPLRRIGIGVDPSTWGPELGQAHDSVGQGIETGIVAAGIDQSGPPHVWVLADLSCRASPNEWAKATVKAYRDLRANAVVPEKNNAGWVGSILKAEGADVYLDGVTARAAKRIRAEPVAALYEQGRVHHVGTFDELETQMVSWDPEEKWSPDRIDALVHAVTWLAPWKAPSGIGVSAASRTLE